MPLRAAYLVQGVGQLAPNDLAKHREILVTSSYAEFKQAARQRVALWVDKNSTQLVRVDPEWINRMPQAAYPIFVIGYNFPLFAFQLELGMGGFMGHPLSQDEITGAEGGFSVIEWNGNGPGSGTILLGGYKQSPTVDRLLRLSNDLLDGKIVPTPTELPLHNVATATPPTTFLPTLTLVPTP